VPGQVQPEHLHQLQPDRQPHDDHSGHPAQSAVQATLDRVQQLVHADRLKQLHVHGRAAVFETVVSFITRVILMYCRLITTVVVG